MTKEVDALSFVDAIEKQEKSNAAMRELDPGGSYEPAAIWCHHKDGKIVRPFTWWKPGAAEWERRSVEMHKGQAEEARKVFEESEERIRRERLAQRIEIEIGAGADAGNPASGKRSQSGQHEFDVIVV